jgi:signal transduction histidine kinase
VEDISLHILDIVENSIVAKAKRIEIRVIEDIEENLFIVEIEDDGEGMDEATVQKVLDPFFTTRTTRKVGLGLPMLAQSAKESGGNIEISSQVGKGAKVKATFQYNHPDRRPLGDMKATLMTLISSHPEIDFVYEYKKGEEVLRLDTRDIKGSE